jgi:hypothetical protein
MPKDPSQSRDHPSNSDLHIDRALESCRRCRIAEQDALFFVEKVDYAAISGELVEHASMTVRNFRQYLDHYG